MHDIPAWVGSYVGIPFKDYGRDRTGADCWGLTRLIWQEQCGLVLPENAVDPNKGDLAEDAIKNHIAVEWISILPGFEQEFDGVIMSGCYGEGRNMKRAAMHIGIIVRPGVLIHTADESGSACLLAYRERRIGHDIVGFYRHRARFVEQTRRA